MLPRWEDSTSVESVFFQVEVFLGYVMIVKHVPYLSKGIFQKSTFFPANFKASCIIWRLS